MKEKNRKQSFGDEGLQSDGRVRWSRPSNHSRYRWRFSSLGAIAVLSLLVCGPVLGQENEPKCKLDGKRVVFLGASITHGGRFVSILDTQLRANQRHAELINLALPSETCSGLTEPAHPFPRPDLHERLDRVIDKTKPDVIVACYGINDAIYHPYSDERFARFRSGIEKLISKANVGGIELVLLTPLVFDPLPMRKTGKLQPLGADKYSWARIYEGYDDVMKRYANWVLDQSDRVAMVIDLHRFMTGYLADKRASDPEFTLSRDGVHLDDRGHDAIAAELLRVWKIDPQPIEPKRLAIIHRRQQLLRNAWIHEVGNQHPRHQKGPPLEKATLESRQLLLDAGYSQ